MKHKSHAAALSHFDNHSFGTVISKPRISEFLCSGQQRRVYKFTSLFVHAISHLAHEHIYKIQNIINMQDSEHNAQYSNSV